MTTDRPMLHFASAFAVNETWRGQIIAKHMLNVRIVTLNSPLQLVSNFDGFRYINTESCEMHKYFCRLFSFVRSRRPRTFSHQIQTQNRGLGAWNSKMFSENILIEFDRSHIILQNEEMDARQQKKMRLRHKIRDYHRECGPTDSNQFFAYFFRVLSKSTARPKEHLCLPSPMWKKRNSVKNTECISDLCKQNWKTRNVLMHFSFTFGLHAYGSCVPPHARQRQLQSRYWYISVRMSGSGSSVANTHWYISDSEATVSDWWPSTSYGRQCEFFVFISANDLEVCKCMEKKRIQKNRHCSSSVLAMVMATAFRCIECSITVVSGIKHVKWVCSVFSSQNFQTLFPNTRLWFNGGKRERKRIDSARMIALLSHCDTDGN